MTRICILRRMCLLVTRFRTVIVICQLDLDAVIELAYSGEESESEVRNTVFQKL